MNAALGASILVAAVAALFYAAVPGVGAFRARSRWRKFRRLITDSATLPVLRRDEMEQPQWGTRYRFFGRLQAIQGRDRIWLSGPEQGSEVDADVFSIEVDLEGVHIYVLPSDDSGYDGEEPQGLPWRNVSALPAGAQVFLSGCLHEEQGRAVFRNSSDEPLLITFYEGSAQSLLVQAVWCGRQRNEYWNRFTGISLITGFVALFLLGYVQLPSPALRIPALLAFSLSSAPLVAFLPPGVVFLYLYRRYWKRGRSLRAERDLFRLPLKYFGDDRRDIYRGFATSLPDGELYLMLYGDATQLEALSDTRPEVWESSVEPSVNDGQARLFGTTRDGDSPNPRIHHPTDPMAPCVLVKGDPVSLSALAARKARRYEILSALYFALDVIPNVVLLLVVLLQVAW